MVVESMTACTMMQDIPNNTNLTGDDMSLCSMVQDNNEKIKNSTVLADFHNIDQDFVPNEISAILGECLIMRLLKHDSTWFYEYLLYMTFYFNLIRTKRDSDHSCQ